ncbi:GNAT family N-acetyltransferase [Streptomyces sp. WMMC500]|uniref:GNAT family N-acetyltransferase n=1 Tax=Streptomyces sp. WMMC500 TaxID=3015154 RepID=UPI00248AF7E9|nr:GNAT family N-acetyltransferase [Streptomyces sp. WMMC500]WBB59828.1 GNAT family N-acetyltransferase [Streptomyces sp. WMMC500]
MILRQVRDTKDDAEVVRLTADAAFDASHAAKGDPPEEPDEHRAILFRSVVRHLARTDPSGCWLAMDDSGRPVGAALSTRREGTWGLSLLVVAPEAQGKGLGKALLARTLAYGSGCLRGLICGSRHPHAARAYRAAGFTLHPAMRLRGTVDHAGLEPPTGAVIEGGPGQRDLMDSVDRRLRGGAHGPDHTELLRHYQCIVSDDLAGSGYAYLRDGRVELLAATSRRIAARLLTAALLSLQPGATARVADLTADQEWAVDVGLAAGLELTTAGYVCVRGMRPPAPYIPSALFL